MRPRGLQQDLQVLWGFVSQRGEVGDAMSVLRELRLEVGQSLVHVEWDREG